MGTATLWRICFLRADPQDLPTSTRLTVLAVLAYAASDVVSIVAFVPLGVALQATLVDTLLLAALTQWVLTLRGHGERIRQTLMALAGAGAIIAVVVLALKVMFGGAPADGFWLVSLLWTLIVYGHVLRHALEIPMAAGVFAAAMYAFLAIMFTAPFLAGSGVD